MIALTTIERRGSGNRFGDVPPGGIGFDTWEPDPFKELRLLLAFYEIGREFLDGAQSLRQIEGALEARSFANMLRERVPAGKSSISRICRKAQRYFRKKLELAESAVLFECKGRGWSISGLSDDGHRAWDWTRNRLISLGLLQESN